MLIRIREETKPRGRIIVRRLRERKMRKRIEMGTDRKKSK